MLKGPGHDRPSPARAREKALHKGVFRMTEPNGTMHGSVGA
ncbi:hypothetical protein QFZ32_006950 [Streptomyces canus]|nr:hypothetical protein [Streptomyces canus]MDQ1071510.1 hypothetical protein [Streptomyces canus]